MAFFDVDALESMELEVDGALSDRLVVLKAGVGVDAVEEPSPLPGLAPFWIGSAFLFFRGAILSKRMLIFERGTGRNDKIKVVKRRKKTDCDGTDRFHLTDWQKCEVAKRKKSKPSCCHQHLARSIKAVCSELRTRARLSKQ